MYEDRHQLIALTGRKGSGKDTAAQVLVADGYANVKFAAILKEMISGYLIYIGVPKEEMARMIEGDLKEQPMDIFGGKTTRHVMQTLGTEWGREMVWTDIWTNAFKLRAKKYPLVVCTDMRFPSEVETINALGGFKVRVVRDMPTSSEGSEHISEAHIDALKVDVEVKNDSSIAALQARLRALSFR